MNHPPDWSLKKEIQKRKTQQTAGIKPGEARNTPSLSTKPTSLETVPGQIASQQLPATGVSKQGFATRVRAFWNDLDRPQQRIALITAGGIALLLIAMSLFLASSRQADSTSATRIPLPPGNTVGSIAYLRQVGLSLVNAKPVAPSSSLSAARQAVAFSVQLDGTSGTFILMSFDSPASAAIAAFKVRTSNQYSQWTVSQVSNELLLATADTSTSIIQRVANYLTQYLIAPYRGYIPTAAS